MVTVQQAVAEFILKVSGTLTSSAAKGIMDHGSCEGVTEPPTVLCQRMLTWWYACKRSSDLEWPIVYIR